MQSLQTRPFVGLSRCPTCRIRRSTQLRVRAQQEPTTQTTEAPSTATPEKKLSIEKDISKLSRQAAATFAPRASTKVKNPAYRGSTLYWVFEAQSWISLVAGGLLSFNIIFPTDDPSIPRLLGMWSIWMFTVPSLRAKECMPKEKDALNILFLLIPLINVILPFIWKNFGFIFTADVVALLGMYTYKGVWEETYEPMLRGALPESVIIKEFKEAQKQENAS